MNSLRIIRFAMDATQKEEFLGYCFKIHCPKVFSISNLFSPKSKLFRVKIKIDQFHKRFVSGFFGCIGYTIPNTENRKWKSQSRKASENSGFGKSEKRLVSCSMPQNTPENLCFQNESIKKLRRINAQNAHSTVELCLPNH